MSELSHDANSCLFLDFYILFPIFPPNLDEVVTSMSLFQFKIFLSSAPFLHHASRFVEEETERVMAAASAASGDHCAFTIVVEPPDTPGNFKGFNVTCDVLDSDFLMQPVNEADYDSETQACVDRQTGVKSFYDHYVTKRKKKKGLKGVGVECPAPKRSGGSVPGSQAHATEEQPTIDPHFLAPPSRLAVPKGVLNNVAVRRIACGRMPPPQNEAALVMASPSGAAGPLARGFADRKAYPSVIENVKTQEIQSVLDLPTREDPSSAGS